MAEETARRTFREVGHSLRRAWALVALAAFVFLAREYMAVRVRLDDAAESARSHFEAGILALEVVLEAASARTGILPGPAVSRLSFTPGGEVTEAEPGYLVGMNISTTGLFQKAKDLREGEKQVLFDLDFADFRRRLYLVVRRGDRLDAVTFEPGRAFLPSPSDITVLIVDRERVARFSSEQALVGDVMPAGWFTKDGWRVMGAHEAPLARSDALSLLVVKDVSPELYGIGALGLATLTATGAVGGRVSRRRRELDALGREHEGVVAVARSVARLPRLERDPLPSQADEAARLLRRCLDAVGESAPRFEESRILLTAMADLASGALDVLERLKADASALRESEARFRTLADAAPVLIWRSDDRGDLVYVNRRWLEFTGRTEAEELGRGWLSAVHPDDREGLVRGLETLVGPGDMTGDEGAGQGRDLEFRLLRGDGAFRWMLAAAAPVGEAGLGHVGSCTDITARREAEQAQSAANLAKSRFLASASHDLRQPLQAMFFYVEALRGDVAGERGQARLDRLQAGLDVMRELLDGLLDVSRLDAGAVRPKVEEFPLSDLLAQIEAGYAPLAARKGLAWHTEGTAAWVRSDPALLGRMLRNIAENAVRYTETGGIRVAALAEGEVVRVSVRDSGVGIARDQLPQVWEEFYQVGNQGRDRAQGLGLGLAIVRRLSGLLGHVVEVSSTPGEGSEFVVLLPRATAEPAGRATVHVRPAPAGGGRGEGRLAVVVDDDATVLAGVTTTLEAEGFEVLGARSGETMLDRVRAAGRRPDVVVADYRLADGRVGTEAILSVRRHCGHAVPSLILTGEFGPEAQRDAAEHGFGLLRKPVSPRELVEEAITRIDEDARSRPDRGGGDGGRASPRHASDDPPNP
jgi:PAS domain S-box-containing protein